MCRLVLTEWHGSCEQLFQPYSSCLPYLSDPGIRQAGLANDFWSMALFKGDTSGVVNWERVGTGVRGNAARPCLSDLMYVTGS